MITLDKKLLLLSICLLIVVFGIFFSLLHQRDTYQTMEGDYEELDMDVKRPDNFFRDVGLLFFNEEGTISWQLESAEIKGFSQESVLDLIGVEVNVLELKETDSINNENRISYSDISNSSNLKKLYDLNASNANYRINEGMLELSGPIIINHDKVQLELGSLILEDGARNIFAEDGVKVKSSDFLIEGKTLEADFALRNITIEGDEDEQAYLSWEKGSDSN